MDSKNVKLESTLGVEKRNEVSECPCECPLYQFLLAIRGEVKPEKSTEEWCDNFDMMQLLHVSKRTLQTLRQNGTLPWTKLGKKIFYKRSDISRLLNNNYLCNLYAIDRKNAPMH